MSKEDPTGLDPDKVSQKEAESDAEENMTAGPLGAGNSGWHKVAGAVGSGSSRGVAGSQQGSVMHSFQVAQAGTVAAGGVGQVLSDAGPGLLKGAALGNPITGGILGALIPVFPPIPAGECAAAVCSTAASGSDKGATPVYIDPNKHPEAAAHAQDAQAGGAPDTLTIDRAGASGRRAEALKGTSPQAGADRDEYPPAVTQEGGRGASVRPISPSDNRGAGGSFGQQIKTLPDGSQIQVIVGSPPSSQ